MVDVRRFFVTLTFLAATMLFVACTSAPDAQPPGDSAVSTTTAVPSPLRTRLELASSSLAAGTTLHGQVVVENNTDHPIDVIGCVALFGVGLSNESVHQEIAFLTCAQPFVIPQGESSWPVSVLGRYTSCSNDPSGATAGILACLADSTPPLLPAGRYTTTVYGPSGIPASESIAVDVT